MIYASDDIIQSYVETLACLLSYGNQQRFSPSFVERSIAYSQPFSELENGNSRMLAFSSSRQICLEVFFASSPTFKGDEIYTDFGWIAETYIHLFLQHRPMTFEFLFLAFPLSEMVEKYPLFHEMDHSQIEEEYRNRIQYSKLDVILKRLNISTSRLAQDTGISMYTIRSLRYGYRQMGKTEAETVIKIASYLGIKPLSLL